MGIDIPLLKDLKDRKKMMCYHTKSDAAEPDKATGKFMHIPSKRSRERAAPTIMLLHQICMILMWNGGYRLKSIGEISYEKGKGSLIGGFFLALESD
jgi:hypothetical protein